MTTKQNPTVKVGDILIIRRGRMGGQDFTEKVIRVTPTGLIKTANRTLGPNLRIRGLPRWSNILCQAELATPEKLAEIKQRQTEDTCRHILARFNWHTASGDLVTKVCDALIQAQKEEKGCEK